MTEYTKGLVPAYAKTRPTTHRVEQTAMLGDKVVRVVASFNRTPAAADVTRMVNEAFDGKARVIDGTFRMRMDRTSGRAVVAGYVGTLTLEKPLEARDGMREIAANVFMDKEDQQIWAVNGDKIVRAATEDLTEIASAIELPRTRAERPDVRPMIAGFEGPTNTQMVAYVDPETAALVTGFRVGEDHVWSETAGLAEVAEDQVVDTMSLNGADLVDSKAEQAKLEDVNTVVDYYREIAEFDPAYFAQVEGEIRKRAVA